jgi:ankyrin repeat protein
MRAKITLALLIAAVTLSAQEPSSDDRFYRAIRNNDLGALRLLVKQVGVDHKDSVGQTPLVLAAAFGTADAMELLLASGAKAADAGSAGIAPLHASRGDVKKVRLLLERGADANARTQLGRTPLIVAASSNGTADAIHLLIEAGADVNAADNAGTTPLMAAARADDMSVAKLLVAKGADVNHIAAGTGQSATALMAAAYNGNTELVRLLLARGARVDPVSRDFTEVVKNGRVLFGRNTALHMAVASGKADVVKLLLDAGAAVNPQDVRDATPLIVSLSNDRPQPAVIRLLLEKGANPSLRSSGGESAVDWARKFNNPAVLAAFNVEPVAVSIAQPAAISSPARDDIRQAVERSMPLLRTAASNLLTRGGCVACHAQPITAMAIGAARDRGWRIDPADEQTSQVLARLSADVTGLIQGQDRGGLPDTHLFTGTMMASLRMQPSRSTDALVHYLAAKQRRDGSWQGAGAIRPPIGDGNFSRTAMGIRTLVAYATPARRTEFEKRVDNAARWLATQTPVTTEDRVMQLLGLKWASAHTARRQILTRELIAMQRPDGGWAQTPHLTSDAYATGQVVYTLREIGVPASDPVIQRGTAFLLRTQHADGSWHVKSRALKIQPYFESGFPHGHDQWISHSAAAWAVMALSMTGPEAVMTRASGR